MLHEITEFTQDTPVWFEDNFNLCPGLGKRHLINTAKHNLAEDQLGQLLAESSCIDYQHINK